MDARQPDRNLILGYFHVGMPHMHETTAVGRVPAASELCHPICQNLTSHWDLWTALPSHGTGCLVQAVSASTGCYGGRIRLIPPPDCGLRR